MRLGVMVVDGRSYPVASVVLTEGVIQVTTETMPGPIPAVRAGRLSIFGADGRGIVQSDRFNAEGCLAGEQLSLRYNIKIATVQEAVTVENATITRS